MGGAPGLHAALRDLKPFRYLIHLLIHIRHIHISADTVAYVDLEFRLNGLLDDKDNLLKSSLFCIKNGEINDDVAILIHRVNLLQTAVTASHTCCHDYQYRFFSHVFIPLSLD